jgi:hypothetical protein
MGGQVGSAPACYGSSLGSNPDIAQNTKMGDIAKGVVNTLKPAKNIYKIGFQNIISDLTPPYTHLVE